MIFLSFEKSSARAIRKREGNRIISHSKTGIICNNKFNGNKYATHLGELEIKLKIPNDQRREVKQVLPSDLQLDMCTSANIRYQGGELRFCVPLRSSN